MSLILEALRKSEAERRRGETPNVHSQWPQASRPARPRLPPKSAWLIIAGTLAVAAVGLEVLRRQSTQVPVPVVAHRVQARPHASPALPPVAHLTPPPVAAAPAEVIATPSRVQPANPTAAPAPPPVIAAPIAPPPAVAAPRDDALRLSDLDPEQRKQLPPLKLSMHMWNDDPRQRFVILDGNRLGEGDRVGDAVVTAITQDGVVLDWNGRKLEIPIR